MKELLEQLKNKVISLRQFIARVKQDEELIQYTINNTSFLNEYNPDILERLYYIINDLHEIVRCKYCNNKAIWSKRISDGYKDICSNKECRTKQLQDVHTGNTSISDNRDKTFIEWQNSVITINDDIIIENIKYDKYIDLITNPALLYYLDNRFKDSSSRLETLQRIKLHIEQKSLCPICGKPVSWVGKKNKLFTTYCSNTCAGNSKDKQEKIKNTLIEHWGTANCYDSPKYKALMKEKYGVEYTWQREDIKEKRKKTLLERYSVEHPTQNKEIMNKVWQTCKEHMSYATSKEEDNIYNWLLELGYNVERSYKSEEYPFNCDFYLKDFNVYIEYNGSQFHHGYAYLGTKEDNEEYERLLLKASDNLKSQYNGIIDTWYFMDPNKRNCALSNNVNLLELYDCKTKESLYNQLSFYINCLLGNKPYTINESLLNKEYKFFKKLNVRDISECSNTYRHNNIVKEFQCTNFYKNEFYIFGHNHILRRKLIQNRMKYLNKKESELTINDLLRGFKISGIHYGYSHFNPEWTNWFINKFGIKSVYDPCGGWGHHMLGMLNCKKIIYNDLSTSTYEGVCKMKNYFNIDNLFCYNNDACIYVPENVDAWFMCPPYYNLESYDCGAFKDIAEYTDFLNKVFIIWFEQNTASIFGLIIREDFYDLIDERFKKFLIMKNKLNSVTSHLVKSKKYNEYFYILKKDYK